MAYEPQIQQHDEVTEDQHLKHAYDEVDRAMRQASQVLDHIRDSEQARDQQATLLDDLEEFIQKSGEFTSRWSVIRTSRWEAQD